MNTLWLIWVVSTIAGCLVIFIAPASRHKVSISGALLVSLLALAGWQWNISIKTEAESRAQFVELLPTESRPDGYVSSDQCRSCHPGHYDSWHKTYHRTMTQHATPQTVIGDFNNVFLYDENLAYHLTQDKDAFFVTIYQFPDNIQPHQQNIASHARLENKYRVGLLTGSHHMQVVWLTPESGNLQRLLPFAWLKKDNRWVKRKDVFLRDPDLPEKVQLWNKNCYRCHSTAAQPRPNLTSGEAHTRLAETGIGCEACHGPGQSHIDFFSNPINRYTSHSSGSPSLTTSNISHSIVHPEKLSHKKSSQVCGQCHSVKWFVDGPELWENGFDYKPGDDMELTTPVVRPRDIDNQPWLHSLIQKSPDILHRQFWPDGEVRVSGREYNGLIESPCYQKGTLSCMRCHQMHGADPNDQLAKNMNSDHACTQCHKSISSDITAHTRHAPASEGSRCYNCHMPHTTYGLLKAIRSHEISSPSIKNQLDSGRPNACSLCHLDKPLDWVSDNLQSWFKHPSHTLSEDQKEIPEGLRMALADGPNQRALIAWHLGWKPAIDTSSSPWAVPLLLELFKDRYSAVRYLAAESLTRLVPDSKPLDYVASPEIRTRETQGILNSFLKSLPPAGDKWISTQEQDKGSILSSLKNRLIPQRPKKPVDLVE